MTDTPVAAHDLPADAFPFTMTLVDHDSGKEVFNVYLDGPTAVRVPGLEEHGAARVDSVVYTNDGKGEMMTHDNSYYEWTLP